MTSKRTRAAAFVFFDLALACVAVFWAFTATAGSLIQTDWSGGPTGMVVVTEPGRFFSQAESVSWLSVRGQIALSSTTLPSPLVTGLTNGAYQGAESVYATDIDGDGDVDIVAAAYPGDVSWWRNEGGNPVVWSRFVISSTFVGANQVFASDMDGDGDTDVAGAAYLSSNVSWWRNDGGDPIVWSRRVIDSAFAGACSVYAGDLDGDFDLDIVSTAFDGDSIAWWENHEGDGSVWLRHEVSGDFGRAHEVWAHDLDGDGDLDLIGAAWEGDNVVWWRNDGGAPIVWSASVIDQDFEGASSIDVFDIDGDGDPDVIGAARIADQVAWWSNDGGIPIQWTKYVIASGLVGAWSVFAADVDGDGRGDLLAAVWFDGQLRWWRNRGGQPVSWTSHVVDPSLEGASAVHAADVDGDGALEVLAAGYDSADVVVYELTRFVETGWLETSIVDTGTGFWQGSCTWEGSEALGTTLWLQGRTMDDPGDDDPWIMFEAGEVNAALGSRRYLQIRVNLSTSNPQVSPILEELSCSWRDAAVRGPVRRAGPG